MPSKKRNQSRAESFVVKPFDPESCNRMRAISIFCGKSGSGKSEATKHIVCEILTGKYKDAILFSQTAQANKEWDGIIHPSKIYKEFNETVLETFMAEAEKDRSELKELDELELIKHSISKMEFLRRYDEITFGKFRCFIVDDGGVDTSTLNNAILKKCAKMARHFLLDGMILLQRIMDVPQDLRNNAFFTFVYDTGPNFKNIHEQLFPELPLREFKELYSIITQRKYSMIVRDMDKSAEDSPPGMVTYYTWRLDKPVTRRRMCGDEYWATCQAMCRPNLEELQRERTFVQGFKMEQERQRNIALEQSYAGIDPNIVVQWREQQQQKEKEKNSKMLQVSPAQSVDLGLPPGIYPLDTVVYAMVMFYQRSGQSVSSDDVRTILLKQCV